MAVITNLATLTTAVADYLARDDLTTFIPNFIQNTENKLRELNLRNEETALSIDVSSGVSTVPTDFKRLKHAYYDGTPTTPLTWVTLEQLYAEHPDRSVSTTPIVISREAGNFIFGPVATDGTAVLKGTYYAKQDPLRTTDPSWYVTNAPEVLLYGSLLESAPFIHGDERLPIWQSLYNDAVRTLREENQNAEISGGQLRQRVA